MGFKDALPKGNPVLLEPIMKIEVIVPRSTWVTSRRPEPPSWQDAGHGGTRRRKAIHGTVPLSEMFGYAKDSCVRIPRDAERYYGLRPLCGSTET